MCSITAGVNDASTLELVEAASAIAAELAGRDAPVPGMAALELAESLGGAIDVLEAALAGLVGRVDDTGVFGELGFSSAGAWLRGRLGMRDGRAAERVRLARQLPRLTQVAGRLAGGSLSAGYAGAIADAVARLDDIDAELGEELLLGLVEQGHTAGQVAKDAAQITDLINTHRGKDKEPEDSKRGFSRSWITKSTSLDGGLWLKAWLTPEHGATFDQIIGPMAKPKAKGDDRDLGQRTADALMSVICKGNKGAGVTVIIDLEAFTQATGDTGPMGFTHRADDAKNDAKDDPGPANGREDRTRPDDGAARPLNIIDLADADDLDGMWGDLTSNPANGEPAAGGQSTGDSATGGTGTDDQSSAAPTAQPRDLTEPDASPTDLQGDVLHALDGAARTPDDPAGCDHHGPPPPRPGTPKPSESPEPPRSPETPPSIELSRTHRRNAAINSDTEPCAGIGHPAGDTPRPVTPTGERVCQPGRNRAAARLLNGTPISPERARQIALNAGINVLILGRSGLPLYLGRTVRFATPAQRKALLALYETCCVEGCQIPAHLAEIHHLDGGWKLATPTDIDRLAPACGWHNRWAETHPDQVEQTADAQGRVTLRLLTPWERRAVQAA